MTDQVNVWLMFWFRCFDASNFPLGWLCSKNLTSRLRFISSTWKNHYIKTTTLKNHYIATLCQRLRKLIFLREEHQRKCEEDIMRFYLKEHQNNLNGVIKSLSKDWDSMVNMIGINLTLVSLKCISKEQYKQRILLL